MAHAGQIISNPITGERITFLQTARDTQGRLLLFDCRVTPGGSTLPAHIHATQEERLTVVSGALGVTRGDNTYRLQPGQSITLPPKVKHQWWIAADEEVRMRVTVTPACNLETVLEVLCRMAQNGATDKHCLPKDPFQLVTLGRLSDTYVPGVPIWMQRSMLAVAAPVAWLLGYELDVPQYRTSEIRSQLKED